MDVSSPPPATPAPTTPAPPTTPGPAPAAAVVALKPTVHAKSRLATLPDPLRRRLAWAMALDTLTALAAATEVLLVVSAQPALAARLARAGVAARVLAERSPGGMNQAIGHGASVLRAEGHRRVLAAVGDLPALRPGTVVDVLAAAPAGGRGFVGGASGVGTTLLVADGVAPDPRFQGRSAAAHHASGAVPLVGGWADARRDVDTEVDLAAAHALGLGPATRALLDPATGRPAAYTPVTAGPGWAVTDAGVRVALPDDAWADALRSVRAGQRLHAVVVDARVRSAWL